MYILGKVMVPAQAVDSWNQTSGRSEKRNEQMLISLLPDELQGGRMLNISLRSKRIV